MAGIISAQHEGNILISKAIVFDFGSKFIKCGYSGEECPRYVLNTKDILPVMPSDKVECTNVVLDMLNILYFRYLLTKPSGRRVLVCEDLLAPQHFRESLGCVLLQHFKVPSVAFLPNTALAVYATGHTSGLVIDCGHEETRVLPIFQGVPLHHCYKYAPTAGKSTQQCVAQLLTGGADETPEEADVSLLPEVWLQNVVARMGYVAPAGGGTENMAADSQDDLVDLRVPAGVSAGLKEVFEERVIEAPSSFRWKAAEPLFTGDDEGHSVVRCALEALLASPVDTRRALAQNIVLTGGTASLPGFEARLLAELVLQSGAAPRYARLTTLLSSPSCVRIAPVPFPASIVGWVGGSLVASLPALASMSTTLEDYLAEGGVYDWMEVTSRACKLGLLGAGRSCNGVDKASSSEVRGMKRSLGRQDESGASPAEEQGAGREGKMFRETIVNGEVQSKCQIPATTDHAH